MRIGNREFVTTGHTYVMGILNVTPDSFSDGGLYHKFDDALYRAQKMADEGADLIDVGGESTRPGYTPVPEAEEIERVAPVIEAIKARIDIPVSVDTYKAGTARAAIAAGADLINDISGLTIEPALAQVIAEAGLPCCLTHYRPEADYEDFLNDWIGDMKKIVLKAIKSGVRREQIILDPGIGFGKTADQNLLALRHLGMYHELDYPVLLGASRKSVIGSVLGNPVEDRLIGTVVTTVRAVFGDCMIVRVHDVKENVEAIRMAEAIRHAQ